MSKGGSACAGPCARNAVLGALALMALAASACDRIFPFNPVNPAQDTGVELPKDRGPDGPISALDHGLADGPTTLDSNGTEGPALTDGNPVGDAPILADASVTPQDSATVAADGPVAPQDSFVIIMDSMCVLAPAPVAATPCIDTESASSNGCPGLCVSIDDTDCDGLKDGPGFAQDPWPGNRNLLFVGDGFTTAVAGRWLLVPTTGPVTQDLNAGTVTAPHNVEMRLEPLCEAEIHDSSFMVETRFTLSAAAETLADWRFQVRLVEAPTADYRDCRLVRFNTQNDMLLVVFSLDSPIADPGPMPTGITPVQDDSYLLQTWHFPNGGNETMVCRLLDGDGHQELQRLEATFPAPLAANTVRLMAFKAETILDHVRVYDF